MIPRTRRIGGIAALALATVLALSACSTPAPEQTWREQVSQAASAASAGDYATATATLRSVEQDVTAARDGNLIDGARADEILAAVAVVQADLATLATPSPSPSATTTPSPSVGTTGDSDDDAEDAPGNGGPGNSGNDKGPDKPKPGKGNTDDEDDE